MKTKFLLGAMALPLFIAACSQEDIVNENSLTNLGERKTVDVTISLDEETMSRMAFVGGDTPYAWETGDQFGAALMDVPANGAAYPNYSVGFWNRFDLVDYIHTNYPFTRQSNGNWTSEAVMSEGNYFFYYPYNSNLGGRRSALKLEIPTAQYLADGAKASSALDQQLFVGYSSVQAQVGKEKESLTLKMEPLLAFPGFRLKSSGNSTEPITIRKIAYHSGEESFPMYYEVKPATAVKTVNEDGTVSESAFNAYTYENSIQTEATKRANIVKIAQAGGETNQVSLTFGKNGKTLKAGQSTLGYIMLPPMTKTGAKLYIYTDKGLGVVDLSKAHVDAGTSATNIANDRALTTIAYNDNAIVNVEFDNTAFAQPFVMNVRSTDELVDLVNWSSNNTKAALNANLIGDNIELDPQIISILKNSAKNGWDLSLNITGNQITIPAETVNDALLTKLALNVNTVVIEEGADVKLPALSGSTYVNKDEVYKDEEGNIKEVTSESYSVKLVKNYGTVELVARTTAPDFYNVGVVNIKGATNANETTTANVAKIENWGTVNVNATGTSDAQKSTIDKIENKYIGKVNVNSGKVVIDDIDNAFYDNGYSTYKRGEIAVKQGATVNIVRGSNRGLILNNGVVTGGLKNESKNTDLRSNGTYYIPSEIQNGGTVEGITNFGLVTMTSATASLTSATAIDGEVNNNIESPYVSKVDGETIFVQFEGTYKASDVANKLVKTNALELRLSGELTADPEEGGDGWSYIVGNQTTLNVVATGNLEINGQVSFYSVNKTKKTKFTVNANTTTDVNSEAHLWLGTGELVVNGKLNINSGAYVTASVPVVDSNKLKVYGTLNNKYESTGSEESSTIPAAGYKEVNNVYEIYTAEGLKQIAADLNGGVVPMTAELKLMSDINLNNAVWTPIGGKNNRFNGTFDGNGKTIYGLSVNTVSGAGLFGWCQVATIKSVTVNGANIEANNYAGVIAGHFYGKIEGCKVLASNVTCSYRDSEDDGATAGAIVGFVGEGLGKMLENSSAESSKVVACRKAGQLVGFVNTNSSVDTNSCYASGVTVEWNGVGSGQMINNGLIGNE